MHEIHTKYLFVRLLENLACDLILDVGSLDGRESLIFKRAHPIAPVVAFEANPDNARLMAQDPDILASGVMVKPMAVWNEDGRVSFNVTDTSTTLNNMGTSSILSILREPELVVREVVEVPCTRLDTFLASQYPNKERVAVWMDIEGTEYYAIEGMKGCLDRIVMLHVETANTPMREGQRLFAEVHARLSGFGFNLIGTHFDGRCWGDVLYVKSDTWSRRDFAAARFCLTAQLMHAFPRRRIAEFLFSHLPSLHRRLKHRFRASPWLSGY